MCATKLRLVFIRFTRRIFTKMSFNINYQSLTPVTKSLPTVSTQLTWTDYLGAVKVRWGIGRGNYTVKPGLYKVGNPT